MCSSSRPALALLPNVWVLAFQIYHILHIGEVNPDNEGIGGNDYLSLRVLDEASSGFPIMRGKVERIIDSY